MVQQGQFVRLELGGVVGLGGHGGGGSLHPRQPLGEARPGAIGLPFLEEQALGPHANLEAVPEHEGEGVHPPLVDVGVVDLAQVADDEAAGLHHDLRMLPGTVLVRQDHVIAVVTSQHRFLGLERNALALAHAVEKDQIAFHDCFSRG
jgi:hypothetical protein